MPPEEAVVIWTPMLQVTGPTSGDNTTVLLWVVGILTLALTGIATMFVKGDIVPKRECERLESLWNEEKANNVLLRQSLDKNNMDVGKLGSLLEKAVEGLERIATTGSGRPPGNEGF